MKTNTSKERNFYTQGQRFAARILFILWLLASVSPEGALATPTPQAAMVPATRTSPRALMLSVDRRPTICPSLVPLTRETRLLPRTIDKLASPFSRLRHVRDLRLQARPAAERDEAGSNGLEVTSSPATLVTLEELMSQAVVPDNQTLAKALNAASPEEQHRWIAGAIKWFGAQSIVNLKSAAIQDYAALAHVKVTTENREQLESYFNSLCNKIQHGPYGEELLIQALAYILEHIDIAVFNNNPASLIRLANDLLAKLERSKNAFIQATYPTDRATLEALSQTLFLVQKMVPSQLNRRGGLYQSLKQKLKDIAQEAQYYPVRYYAQRLEQTLELLAKTEKVSQRQQVWEGCKAVLHCLEGGLYLYQGVNKLAPFSPLGFLSAFNPNTFRSSYSAFKQSSDMIKAILAKPGMENEFWYDWLFKICANSFEILQGDGRYYPILVSSLENIRQGEGASAHDEKAQRALRFGIVMQLQRLALQGPTAEVRKGIIERLIGLAHPEAWGADTHVMAGLLDSLGLVAIQHKLDSEVEAVGLVAPQGQLDRAAEAAMAQEALGKLEVELQSAPAQQPGRWWQRLFDSPRLPQNVASNALTQWLEGETLTAKLQRLREQTTQPAPSDEERLFSHVKRTLRRTATIESFRAQEIVSLSKLSSYIALTKLKHFVERTATTKQLSATLSQQGVCVLNGFGGAGKSTLAAHYGHARKETQTVRWIGAEDSRKLQEGYEQLAQELQVAYQPLAEKLAANPSQYRQELARMVYNALARNSQPTLLILDNAEDTSLVPDYLLHRPDAIQAIITTRNAETFEGTYEQLQLDTFNQDEGQRYLEARFKAMKRPYTNPEAASLLEEVGLVPQKLNLAAGYLQANKLVKAAQYIARLQALKQAGTKQQGKLTLP